MYLPPKFYKINTHMYIHTHHSTLFKKKLSVRLHWVLVATCGVFSFSMWDLVP